MTLMHLIAKARGLANDHPCDTSGHIWQTEGGRACPRGGSASQTVYRCARCGDWDYGEPGGPGAADCAQPCTLSCANAEAESRELPDGLVEGELIGGES